MLLLQGHLDAVRCLTYLPDGQTIASGSDDHTAILWDIAAGKARHTLYHGDGVEAVAGSPDSKTLATGRGLALYYFGNLVPVMTKIIGSGLLYMARQFGHWRLPRMVDTFLQQAGMGRSPGTQWG